LRPTGQPPLHTVLPGDSADTWHGKGGMVIYPRPVRSDQERHFVKTPDNDVLDIGWDEGVLSDGRPYVAEFWCQDQVSLLTFFFSRHGLEEESNESLKELLVREGLVAFESAEQFVVARPCRDASGNDLWSVNIVVGDEDSTFVRDNIPLRRYANYGPNLPRKEGT
jgi:hypothetical protein